MQIGSYSLEVLSEGRFEIFDDGHINRSKAGEEGPMQLAPATGDANASNVVGINPILVKTGPYNILLDAGLGWGLDVGSNYKNVSNVKTNLDIFGLRPEDITHVVLTHLHYDHAAGCTYTAEGHKTKATFPNATYYFQQREWEYALSKIETEQQTPGADYNLDDLYCLMAENKVELLEENSTTIVEGITAIRTGGHTPGHQIVVINNHGQRALYLGDLLPTSKHLNRYSMEQMDYDSIQAKKRKVQLLRSAFEERACLFFYHSLHSQMGSIEIKDRQYVLKEL